MSRRERSKAVVVAAAASPQTHRLWWWSPRALLSPPQSIAVSPLSPAAPVATPAARSHQLLRGRSPPMLHVLRLVLVLATGSVCGRLFTSHAHSSVLDGALQGRNKQQQQQWEQYADQQHRGVRTAAPAGSQDDWSEYECVAWREASSMCTASDRAAEQQLQWRGCDESISLKQHDSGGFCELRHKRTGESKRMLTTQTSCNNNDRKTRDHPLAFQCADFQLYLTFAQQAAEFKFDPDFSYGKCRQELINDQVGVNRIRYASAHKIPFQKGIAIVHQSSSASHLMSGYESIQRLRSTGCALPIEFWYNSQAKTESESETQDKLVLVQKMAKTQDVYPRAMWRDDGNGASTFEGPFAKAYVAFHSAFDKVLVLDGLDSFAAMTASGNNPGQLFTAKEFVSTGAIFWQDEHHTEPKRVSGFAQTLFGLHSGAGAALFPQDTDRLLIDRRQHLAALNALMYYVVHRSQLDSLQIVHSEKDLYQIAWAATKSAFHVMSTTSRPAVGPESRANAA